MLDRELVLIVNPAAGRARAAGRTALCRLSAERGAVALRVSERPGHARELAREAARGGAQAVAAVGGDGTVAEVLNGILDSGCDTPLGIIPAGTGNDIAQSVGVPLSAEAASASLVRARTRRLDVATANDDRFFGLGMIGFSADVGRTVNHWKSGRLAATARLLGRQVYRVVAVHHMLLRSQPVECSVEAPGYRYSGRAFTVLIGNQPGVGGLFHPCPEARCDDGLLDLCLIRAEKRGGSTLSIFDKTATLHRAVRGMHLALPWVDYIRTAGPISVRTAEPALFLADGDELLTGSEFVVGILPAAISVIA